MILFECLMESEGCVTSVSAAERYNDVMHHCASELGSRTGVGPKRMKVFLIVPAFVFALKAMHHFYTVA